MQYRHGRQIQGVPGGLLKGPDAPLAEDHVGVALAHNVFCTHQQFFNGVRQATLQQDWLAGLAQLPEQIEILHIPGAYLDDVHVLEKVQGGDIHDFRDDGHTRGLLGFQQQPDAVVPEALERIRRGPGLESTAPEDGRPGFLNAPGHGNNLFFGFHGARARDHGKIPTADSDAPGLHDGILGVEFPVGLLIGFADPLDTFHHIQAPQQVHVHPAGVADEAQHRHFPALGNMHVQVHGLEPVGKALCLFVGNVSFQYCDHLRHLPKIDKK